LQLISTPLRWNLVFVFMPGNNRQRVARPFGRRFVNSEVTHAFTTGKFSIRCRGTSPATYPSRLLSRSFQHRLTSVGEHSTGAVHQRPFPIAALCFEAAPQPLRALAPADILFRTPHFACLAGSISRLPPPTVFLMLRSKTAQNHAQLALTTKRNLRKSRSSLVPPGGREKRA
jgi:hypothetical protein